MQSYEYNIDLYCNLEDTCIVKCIKTTVCNQKYFRLHCEGKCEIYPQSKYINKIPQFYRIAFILVVSVTVGLVLCILFVDCITLKKLC